MTGCGVCRGSQIQGLLYVVIRDKKNPQFPEIMVFADDAAKVNRVLDKMNLDFVKSEAGGSGCGTSASPGRRACDRCRVYRENRSKEELPAKTEKVVLPEGTIEFELDEEEHLFDVGKSLLRREILPRRRRQGICPDLPRTAAVLFPGRKLAGKGRNHLSGRN